LRKEIVSLKKKTLVNYLNDDELKVSRKRIERDQKLFNESKNIGDQLGVKLSTKINTV
jgi:hypothetical protein